MNADFLNDAGELEIMDLEYDVAGAGSAEAGDAQVNNLAIIVIMFGDY